MHRLRLSLLFNVSVFACLTLCLPAHSAGVRNPGDLTGDGTVNVVDAVLLLQSTAGMTALTPDAASVADVNGDGSTDVIDAVAILRAAETGEIPRPPTVSAARFHVDVSTKRVEVLPLTTTAAKSKRGGIAVKAVFAGSSVTYNSGTLLDLPGDTGIKSLQVSVRNNTGFTLGRTSAGTVTGMKTLFSDFTNLSAPADLRPKTLVSTVAGTGAFGCDDGPVGGATIYTPSGIAVGPDGTIYFADTGCNKIRTIKGGEVSTLAGNGVANGIDGAGSAASFNGPRSLAFNPVDGALIVSEYYGHRIRRVTKDGLVNTVAGNGAAGFTEGSGAVAQFSSPIGVAVDPNGVIYVADSGSNRIRRITLTGPDPRYSPNYTVDSISGNGTAGFADGAAGIARYNAPAGLAMDGEGHLYVADYNNQRIRRINFPLGEVTTIAGTGVAGSLDGTGDAATLNYPVGVAVVNGAVVVVEFSGHRVRQLTVRPGGNPNVANGWIAQTLAGTTGGVFADGPGNAAWFKFPYGIGADGAGNLYVGDVNNRRIRKVTPANGYFPVGAPSATTVTEPVALSNPDGAYLLTNVSRPYIQYPQAVAPGETSAARKWDFTVPAGVTAFDFTVTLEADTDTLAPPTGVTNPEDTGVGSPDVNVRTLTGHFHFGFQDGTLAEAIYHTTIGIARDAAGNLYVADQSNESIRRIGVNGVVSTIAGVEGKGIGSSDGLGTVAQFSAPFGVAVTPDGSTVYVADNGAHTVRRIALTAGADPALPASWTVSTIAGLASTVGYVDNTSGDLARFNRPYGIALTPGGNLYVTEQFGNRVRRMHLVGANPALAASWRVSLVAGDTSNAAGLSGTTDGFGSVVRFGTPQMIAADGAGNLYVADANNNRIRKITPEGLVTTLAGQDFGYQDGAGVAAKFSVPTSLAADSAGYLYVGELNNARIRRVSPAGVVTTVAGTGVANLTDGPGTVATVFQPRGMVTDPSGTLYFTDGQMVRMVQRVVK